MQTIDTSPMTDQNPASETFLEELAMPKSDVSTSSPSSDFERQWLEDYLNGDDSGFLSLYHRYKAQLYRYLLAHMSVDIANRLYVQSWIEFLNHAKDIPTDISPGAALFAEAHRLVLEGYRAQDKSILLSFADGVIETVNELAGPPLAENSGLEQTQLEILQPAWREALQIYLETGFDGDSLAYALHVSRETARSRLKRAFNQWRKCWPGGDTGVEDSLLRSTQHWIHFYRTLVSIEPPEYLDARIVRHADWHSHWLSRLGDQIQRYWHIGLTIIITAIGVFGYLWTMTAAPNFTLELTQSPPPKLEIASAVVPSAPASAPVIASATTVMTASAPIASSKPVAVAVASAAQASAIIAKPMKKMTASAVASGPQVQPAKPAKNPTASSNQAGSASEAPAKPSKPKLPADVKTHTEFLNLKTPAKRIPNAAASAPTATPTW